MMTRAFPAALHATTNTDDNSVMQVPNCYLVPPPLHEKKSALLIKISGKLKQISSLYVKIMFKCVMHIKIVCDILSMPR